MSSPENKEWEYLLNIDDSDLQLSAPFRLSNSSNTSVFQSQEIDYADEKSTRVIPSPAGRIHKLRNFKDDPTQEYIRKLIDDVDDDFKRRPWYGKLEKVVAIITSCKPNVLGDMNVTLKDLSGIMSGTIHYKVLSSKDGYIKDIKVGYALILRNIFVFSPKSSNCALNITLKNLVKIFKKDTIVEDADGASGSNI
ncbi:copia protein [Tanacetum coccineum]